MAMKDLLAAAGRSIDNTHWGLITVLAVWLALAPWPMGPEPHLVEKARFLAEGTLTRPIDIFDVFYHLVGLVVLAIKGGRQLSQKSRPSQD